MEQKTVGLRFGVRIILCVCLALLVIGLAPSPARADFGFEQLGLAVRNEDDSAATQAGSHPYAVTTSLHWSTISDPGLGVIPDGSAKGVVVDLPPGFAVDPNAVPRCSSADFQAIGTSVLTRCPDSSAVGVFGLLGAGKSSSTELTPVYNLVPAAGVASKLGFRLSGVSAVIEGGIRDGGNRNLYATVDGISQAELVFGSTLTLWGNPGSPAHDAERGHCVLLGGSCPVQAPLRPFITLPRSCDGPLVTRFEADSWQNPGDRVSGEAQTPGMNGCGELGFSPAIEFQPTANAARAPTALDFSLDLPADGLSSPIGLAQSDLRKALVRLPEGMTVNAAIAAGLGACSADDYARETLHSAPGAGCPGISRIGTAAIESPLLEGPLTGALFVAKPGDLANLSGGSSSDSLLSVYIILREPKLGVLVKQTIELHLDAADGRLTATIEDIPELPFSHLELHLRQGTPNPLITPASCGAHALRWELTPSAGGPPLRGQAEFTINQGCAAPGFRPVLSAGVTHPQAGATSPLVVDLTRSDGDQNLSALSLVLPPGLSANFAAVPLCPGDRAVTGSCPATSRVGYARIAAGAGATPLWIPQAGKAPSDAYLAGPYGGAPFSLVVVVPALAGPFDLGTVAIRAPISVDPETAQARIRLDRLPQILKGVPIEYRSLRIILDRSGFIRNPTNCRVTGIRGAATSIVGIVAPVADRFQVGDCAGLAFKPKVALRFLGPPHRGAGPRLRAILTARPGDANIGGVTITLPGTEVLESRHIDKVCSRAQFAASKCPAGAVYGHAKAWSPLLGEPLEGPVYLRSGHGKLPDLAVALSGQIDLDLAARMDSVDGRLRTTLGGLPDIPVRRFMLTMRGGKKGLLTNTGGLCNGVHRADVGFRAQNGRSKSLRPIVATDCGKRAGV